MAARSLQANLMRSILACLGVIIGVAAVVSAMAILEGSSRDVISKIETLGADQIFVANGTSQRGQGGRVVARMSLTTEDADALGELPGVKAAVPESAVTAQIKFLEKNTSVQLVATNEEYTEVNNYKAIHGRALIAADVQAGRKYCVLGYKVAEKLFGDVPAVGMRVRIEGMGFDVIGVMEKKGFLGARDVDRQVMIPVSTGLERLFGSQYVSMITVQARNRDDLEGVMQEVKRCLRREHNIRAGRPDDFQVITRQQVTDQVGDMINIFAVVLYSIAGISLVVGGIGIMNIMLVSVTERTREIGVRMAVGARRMDILVQFLIEAGVISVLGGAVGVLMGYAFTDLLENITQILKTYMTTWGIAWALGMAIITGMISGIYPAFRASRLDPVEALRYE
ncbi:MAG TPA: ABC transporter permease [Phycisphaerae bacterium]|nr:ABC transporter permease [Phycisphaerae bacterium]